MSDHDIVIDTGFFLTIRVPVQLGGVSLPSLRTQSHSDRSLARAAKDVAMDLLLNRWVIVETVKDAHRPKTWTANLYLDATCSHEEVYKEVLEKPMVNFSSYMNLLRKEGFDSRAIPLTHAETTKRRRKSFQASR